MLGGLTFVRFSMKSEDGALTMTENLGVLDMFGVEFGGHLF